MNGSSQNSSTLLMSDTEDSPINLTTSVDSQKSLHSSYQVENDVTLEHSPIVSPVEGSVEVNTATTVNLGDGEESFQGKRRYCNKDIFLWQNNSCEVVYQMFHILNCGCQWLHRSVGKSVARVSRGHGIKPR